MSDSDAGKYKLIFEKRIKRCLPRRQYCDRCAYSQCVLSVLSVLSVLGALSVLSVLRVLSVSGVREGAFSFGVSRFTPAHAQFTASSRTQFTPSI